MEKPKRNLEQVRQGGHDLEGFEPFAIEVKRQEVLQLRDWWRQSVLETPPQLIPVVMYRQNRQPWRFLISAQYLGCKNGYIQLEDREFLMWAKTVIEGL